MARKSFPKSSTRQRTVSINVRGVPEDLHLAARQRALMRKVSVGDIYAEALRRYFAPPRVVVDVPLTISPEDMEWVRNPRRRSTEPDVKEG